MLWMRYKHEWFLYYRYFLSSLWRLNLIISWSQLYLKEKNKIINKAITSDYYNMSRKRTEYIICKSFGTKRFILILRNNDCFESIFV